MADPESIGNPITLLIERISYLGIGVFFIAAIYRGVKKNAEEENKSKK